MIKMVAVIGAAQATPNELETAEKIGREIAAKGWILVNGGLGGVMEASAKGASAAGGVVVGILPTPSTDAANRFVTIPVATNMGHARNVIIAHTADIFIAVGGGAGTLSEIAISRKLKKPVLTIDSWKVADAVPVADAKAAIKRCEEFFGR
jgi:uncharacterized protein (TIGR00725 family)